MEPIADDGDRFVRILLGEFADFLHRLGVHLALHLGDIDHRRGAVGDGDLFVAADDRDIRAPPALVMLPGAAGDGDAALACGGADRTGDAGCAGSARSGRRRPPSSRLPA